MEAENFEFHASAPAARTMRPSKSAMPARRVKQHLDEPTEEQPPKEKEPAQSKPRKPKTTYRVKLERARPRILLLIACVAYLVSALVALNIGLLNISNFVQPRFERAQLEHQSQSSTLRRKQIVCDRLEALLSSQLNRGFMETHEDCLVRGLKKADYELLGYAFQYADIRTQVTDWTMENCGRLQYTPQVVYKEPSPQQAVISYWANVGYRSKQTAERALGFVKQIWGRVFGRNHPKNTSAANETAPTGNDTAKVSWDQRLRMEVPFGFTLNCLPMQPCHLVYPLASALRSDKMGVSPEQLAKIKLEVGVLHTFSVHLANHRWAIEHAILVLLIAQSFLVLVGGTAIWCEPITAAALAIPKEKRTFLLWLQASCSKEEKYTAVSVIVEGMAIKALAMLEKGLAASWAEEIVVLLGLANCMLGLTMLMSFFFATKRLEGVFGVYGLIKEIYLIARGRDVPGEKNEIAKPYPVTNKTTNETTLDGDSKEKEKATETQQFKYIEKIANLPSVVMEHPRPHHRLANPSTTVQEDLEVERRNLHEELKQAAIDAGESEVMSETDTESEPEQERFVDLASGVTPDITEIESGWSLVD
jgi:hypothetical protein